MAWTITIKAKEKENGVLRILAEFQNTTSGEKVTDTFLFDGDSLEGLKARVAAKVARLNSVDSLFNALSINQVVDVTPAATTPTDKQTWLENYSKLQYANRLIADGVIQSTLPAYQNLLTAVKNGFKVEYV